jgi:hypothetical protein
MGIWGARSSADHENAMRYHEEIVDHVSTGAGVDFVYCPLSALVGVEKSCITPGNDLKLVWFEDTAPSCSALHDTIELLCVWSDGQSTIASFSQGNGNSPSYVQCEVPQLNIVNGTLTSVDIIMLSSRMNIFPSTIHEIGHTSIYTININQNHEQTNAPVILQYFSDIKSMPVSCGCNALAVDYTYAINSCLVCNGDESNESYVDCNGECFGTAYVDDCGQCAGGHSITIPDNSCNLGSSSEYYDGYFNVISRTIILLTIMICMAFFFTMCLRSIRTSWNLQTVGENMIAHNNGRNTNVRSLQRGVHLSEYEIDSLGLIEYDVDTLLNTRNNGMYEVYYSTIIALLISSSN